MPRRIRLVLALFIPTLLAAGLVTATATSASAHEERPAEFPDGKGMRPTFLGYDNPQARVVCRPESRARIAKMPAGSTKRVNERLLRRCRFGSIQDAINSIAKRKTSIYVLPGLYEERKYAGNKRSYYCSHLGTASDKPLASSEYIGSISSPEAPPEPDGLAARADEETNPIGLSYADQRKCPHNLNLIALFGDRTPGNDSIRCDSRFCGTQIVGTGPRMTDVIVDNRFKKLNAIRLDRAGGALLRNMTFQQAEFNSVYVLETDGFVLDRLTTRGNDEYGILAFASDHGLIQRTNNYSNGDSGIYPGSGSDLNANNKSIRVKRYAIEIRNNRSHHNTLGYSGTAGNSIWAHHNKFFKNATGIATDSLFPGHPGLPQDHARWSYNEVFSNNVNYYKRYVDTGVCDKPMPERGYIRGAVCPVVPTPVGTGVLIAGGNYNRTDHNWIYDNWRYGTMQFWVPAPLRDEMDPAKLFDTSHHNHTTDNHMGFTKDGKVRHNGVDHWWDDQGIGNCWERNRSSHGKATHNFVVPPGSCRSGGSVLLPGLPVKDADFLTCSEYDRADPIFRHPPLCTWLDDPKRPSARPAAGPGAAAPSADSGGPTALLSVIGGVTLVVGLRQRRRNRRAA
jgi:hypothetical protein